VLNVAGKVLNVRGEPVRDAKIEIWQANTYGRYTHPSDTSLAPLDPNFEGAAVLTTDMNGQYRFKTIKPAAYPTGPNTMRPAHIHFQVSGRQDRLVTQMYFEGDPYNETDPFPSRTAASTWVCKRADLSMLRWSMLRSLLTSTLDSEPWKPAPRDM
jgi:protocatechuate 3,4-dioxygenase, beta subunit